MSITPSSDESWNALNRSGDGFRGLLLGSGGGDSFLARDDLVLRDFARSSSDDSERSRALRDGDAAGRDCFFGGSSGVSESSLDDCAFLGAGERPRDDLGAGSSSAGLSFLELSFGSI